MFQIVRSFNILAFLGPKRRSVQNFVTPRELENANLRRAARVKLEQGLLPWGAPTLEKRCQIDHADLIARELGMSQVRVLGHIPNGHDQITVKKHGVILERRSYPSTGEVFGGLQ